MAPRDDGATRPHPALSRFKGCRGRARPRGGADRRRPRNKSLVGYANFFDQFLFETQELWYLVLVAGKAAAVANCRGKAGNEVKTTADIRSKAPHTT
jgi:hypothetical protein